jgi:hypothetical protein
MPKLAKEEAPIIEKLPQAPLRKLSAGELIYDDFESGLGDWTSRGGIQGAKIQRTVKNLGKGKACLKLTNIRGGGDFAARITKKAFDINQFGILAFDIKLTKNIKINLYLLINGKYHTLILSSYDGASFTSIKSLGRVAIKANGEWEHIEVDLKKVLKKLYPGQTTFKVTDLALGNLSNNGYTQAGFNGNQAGASYYIDNFRVFRGNGKASPTKIVPGFSPIKE